MQSLNLQRRFLLMFADYRDAIDAQQSHSDELIRLRATVESLQSSLAAERASSLAREREINDRLMRSRERPVPPVPVDPSKDQNYAASVRQQVSQAKETFYTAINKRREELLANSGHNGPSSTATH